MPYSAHPTQETAQKSSQKASRLWFDLHSWVGLKLSIFISFVLITGTLAVFSHEIDWLLTPAMRASGGGEEKSIGELADVVRRAYPDVVIMSVRSPLDPWFTTEALIRPTPDVIRRVWIDQYTGQITGEGSWANVQRFFRQSHRHLMMPVAIGVPIVSSVAFLLILSLVTGLVVYKKFWRGFFRAPRRNNARIFWGDIHRLSGLWSMWFLLIICFTGLWYLVEQAGGRAPKHPFPGHATEQQAEAYMPMAELQKIAEQTYPTLDIRFILYPRKAGQPIVFRGQAEAILVRDRSNFVSLDPTTGKVLTVADGRDLSTHQRISEMADPLHFGTLAGLPTKVIWFVFGVLLSALSLTGIYIYAKRLVRRHANAALTSIAWQGMGRWRYIGTFLIAICLILSPYALTVV